MIAEDRERIAGLRVTIVSHAFGYSGDLMYFGEIFRSLRQRLPKLQVVVDDRTVYKNSYGIKLLPLMRLRRRTLERSTPDGMAYATEVAIPGPLLLPRLIREKADVIVTIEFTLPALIAVMATSLHPRRGLVLLVESDPAARGGSSNPMVRRIKRWAVKRADVLQTNNERGRRNLVEDLGANPARVRVAPYLTSRPPGPAQQIVLAPGRTRILFANSINERKGLRQFLGALALVPASLRQPIELTVIGDGPERAELEREAAELSLGQVQFFGRKAYDELGIHYAAADILVIPSLADYRSLAGFEGLGYGLALLSSCHDGATEETVQDGINGFVIDPYDMPAVASRILALTQDADLLLRMRQQSLQRYHDLFSLDVIADNLTDSIALAARCRLG
ncbi:glycosyltransferase family 4 protein [Croceibacterium ferulae]|uniref:glycosyltransferase family 4 protein n=1 Tax=Croceibacterium ferulae TaxID=1854641 RepID=UPI000EB5CC35|nr:glycosyltransferase family 4 protein [Croceibacterium ferulae]